MRVDRTRRPGPARAQSEGRRVTLPGLAHGVGQPPAGLSPAHRKSLGQASLSGSLSGQSLFMRWQRKRGPVRRHQLNSGSPHDMPP